ncbi:hypothetical protein Tcan_04361 [Toxocara canis]|uniref:Uncharacterized protein n=1 Tax=Toxocara canis TaxID=6265 RepID=A0A0B2V9G5_TOXCA|nr:hypothetical protein Tcan_04361 [Toxocara canis]
MRLLIAIVWCVLLGIALAQDSPSLHQQSATLLKRSWGFGGRGGWGGGWSRGGWNGVWGRRVGWDDRRAIDADRFS